MTQRRFSLVEQAGTEQPHGRILARFDRYITRKFFTAMHPKVHFARVIERNDVTVEHIANPH